MSNLQSSNGQLKIPTFNTNCIQPSQLLSCHHNIGKQIVNEVAKEKKKPVEVLTTTHLQRGGVIKPTYNNNIKSATINGIEKATTTTANITTTKISVGGKVIDIDVLTKLQQRQRGNIVSFTASKEFLSNLANNKMNNVAAVQRTVTTSEGKVTVAPFYNNSHQGKKVSVIKAATQPHQPKAPQEKLLLPKTIQTSNTTITNSAVQVTKFAPEINGLLTGLSTALKSSTNNNKNNPNVIHHHDVKKSTNITPVAINVISSGKGSNMHKATLLLSGNLKDPIHKSSANTAYVTSYINPGQKATTVQTNVQTTYPNVHVKSNVPNLDLVTKVKGRKNQTHNPQVVFIPPFINHDNKRKNWNKVLCENKNNSNFKIQKLMQNKMGYFAKNKSEHKVMLNENKTENGERFTFDGGAKKVTGFDELYKTAVNNVLNIKTFPDELKSENRGDRKGLKEFEDEFKHYLETPMDIENKINDGVFKFLSSNNKQRSPNNDEPESKRIKLENTLTISSESRTTPENNIESATRRYDASPLSANGVFDLPRKADEAENRKFFSQFLSDQPDVRKPITREYYSPIEFPWFYPSYYFSGYYMTPPSTTAQQQQTSQSTSPVILDHSPHGNKRSRITNSENHVFTGSNISKRKKASILNSSAQSNKTKATKDNTTLTTKNDTNTKLQSSSSKNNILNTARKTTLAVEKINSSKKRNRSERLKGTTTNNQSSDNPLVPKLGRTSCSSLPLKLSNNTPKKIKQKDCQKFRYSLRQRLKELKKSKKYAQQSKQEQPKFILKKLDKKTSTKKELFLACLGLRKILRRVNK